MQLTYTIIIDDTSIAEFLSLSLEEIDEKSARFTIHAGAGLAAARMAGEV